MKSIREEVITVLKGLDVTSQKDISAFIKEQFGTLRTTSGQIDAQAWLNRQAEAEQLQNRQTETIEEWENEEMTQEVTVGKPESGYIDFEGTDTAIICLEDWDMLLSDVACPLTCEIKQKVEQDNFLERCDNPDIGYPMCYLTSPSGVVIQEIEPVSEEKIKPILVIFSEPLPLVDTGHRSLDFSLENEDHVLIRRELRAFREKGYRTRCSMVSDYLSQKKELERLREERANELVAL